MLVQQRHVVAGLIAVFTLMCMLQMLSDFMYADPADGGVVYLMRARNGMQRLAYTIPAISPQVASSPQIRHRPVPTQPVTFYQMTARPSVGSPPRRNSSSPADPSRLQDAKAVSVPTDALKPARAPLKPGKLFEQKKKQLSNGTNVGWLPRYDRDAFPLLHASPACKASDIYVAVVLSAGANFRRRQAIRKTWGSQLKTVFVLGTNETLDGSIEHEAAKYKDIVQAGFRESYYNLTYNTITALRWVLIYCNQAEYIIKGDDDTWFNIEPLKTSIAVIACDAEPMIIGKVLSYWTNRVNTSKWYTPPEVIKQAKLPEFTSGAGYVLTQKAVPLLYNALLAEPLVLNLEDLFVTGFIAEKIGIPRRPINGFSPHRLPNKTVNGCVYNHQLQTHDIEASEMLKLWKDMRNPRLVC